MPSIDKVCADPYGLEIPWCWSLEKLCHSIGNKHRPYFVFRHLSTQFVGNGWTGVFARHQNLYIPYCRHGNGVQCGPGILYCRWKWSPYGNYSSKHHISSEPEHSTFLPHSTTFFDSWRKNLPISSQTPKSDRRSAIFRIVPFNHWLQRKIFLKTIRKFQDTTCFSKFALLERVLSAQLHTALFHQICFMGR